MLRQTTIEVSFITVEMESLLTGKFLLPNLDLQMSKYRRALLTSTSSDVEIDRQFFQVDLALG